MEEKSGGTLRNLYQFLLSEAWRRCCCRLRLYPSLPLATVITLMQNPTYTPTLTRAGLLAATEELTGFVAAASRAAEDTRQLSEAVFNAIRASGIHRMLQPARYGGAEAHFSGMVDIVERMSAACTAAGWCLTQYISHNCLIGYFPPAGQDDVWAGSPSALTAGVLIPRCGTARQTDDGWLVNGRWPFASGIHGADWFIATAFVENQDGPPVAQMHLVPKGQLIIVDTWQTAGLRGTGSADVVVKNCLVPAQRALPIAKTKGGGNAPGCAVHSGPLYKLPAFAMFSINQSAVALGLAQSVLDRHLQHVRTQTSRLSGNALTDYSSVQIKIAEADIAIKTARLLLHDCCDAGMNAAAENAPADMSLKTELRAKATLAGKLSATAIDLIYQLSGGGGIYDHNPLSRAIRDIQAIRGHITQNWDVNAANHGRVLVGLPSADPAL